MRIVLYSLMVPYFLLSVFVSAITTSQWGFINYPSGLGFDGWIDVLFMQAMTFFALLAGCFMFSVCLRKIVSGKWTFEGASKRTKAFVFWSNVAVCSFILLFTPCGQNIIDNLHR